MHGACTIAWCIHGACVYYPSMWKLLGNISVIVHILFIIIQIMRSTSQSTKCIYKEILCLCDNSPPPLASTLMTYRTPIARLV